MSAQLATTAQKELLMLILAQRGLSGTQLNSKQITTEIAMLAQQVTIVLKALLIQ